METQATNALAAANQRLLRRLLIVVAVMFGFGFALAPLYDALCRITGLNGKTSNQAAVVTTNTVDVTRIVTVEFVASLNAGAPWEFAPKVTRIQVHPGEFHRINYFARNLTGQPLTGQAVPSVSPGLAARYFQKIECFCFTQQLFQPGESREMPVTFRIDPDLPSDVHTMTLSYTFFRMNDVGG